jgi:hypothetical protein
MDDERQLEATVIDVIPYFSYQRHPLFETQRPVWHNV